MAKKKPETKAGATKAPVAGPDPLLGLLQQDGLTHPEELAKAVDATPAADTASTTTTAEVTGTAKTAEQPGTCKRYIPAVGVTITVGC